jgi:hypothetical protein
MIGGFALVAYPAAYGNSGIMTFVVRRDGAAKGSRAADLESRRADDIFQSGRQLEQRADKDLTR